MSSFLDLDFSHKACHPTWYSEDKTACPYGKAIPLPFSRFTWHDPLTFMDVVAAILSSAPFALCLYILWRIFWKKGISDVASALLLILTGIFTFIVKAIVQQPRPSHSCLVTCGMPSGHSVACIGLFVWFLLVGHSRYGSIPLLFVPWSRWFLSDHSLAQVCIGSIFGCVLAFGWFHGILYIRKRKPECLSRLLSWCKDDFPRKPIVFQEEYGDDIETPMDY